jgi:hypothetical protein
MAGNPPSDGTKVCCDCEPNVVRIRIINENSRDIRRLRWVHEILADVAKDMPWRDDVRRAKRLLVKVIRAMRAVK